MKVKVWNRNTVDFTQDYKGDKVYIPAGKYIMMDYEDAIAFRGLYYPVVLDGADVPTVESRKAIFIDEDDQRHEILRRGGVPVANGKDLICHVCRFKAVSQYELDGHTSAEHKDRIDTNDLEYQEYLAKKAKTHEPKRGKEIPLPGAA